MMSEVVDQMRQVRDPACSWRGAASCLVQSCWAAFTPHGGFCAGMEGAVGKTHFFPRRDQSAGPTKPLGLKLGLC